MAVDEEVRRPGEEDVPDVAPDLRLLELHVVAVEIEPPDVAPLRVRGGEPVRVELRDDEDRELVERAVHLRSRRREVADEEQHGLAEGALVAVHVRGQHEDRLAERPRLPRPGDRRPGEDGVGELAPEPRLSVDPEPHLRARRLDGGEVVHHLPVGGVGGVARDLRPGPRGLLGRRRKSGREKRERERGREGPAGRRRRVCVHAVPPWRSGVRGRARAAGAPPPPLSHPRFLLISASGSGSRPMKVRKRISGSSLSPVARIVSR